MLGREELIAAARKLWGEPTSKSENEWRFGTYGSKSINLKDLTWYDHEGGAGGGVVDLFELAGLRRTNEQQTNNGAITYDYKDEKKSLLFQVVRMPGHKFRQRKPDGHGGWIWNLQGVRRVLYRLPELCEASPADGVCFICEGEKDTDNLRRLGCVVTTNPGGAGKWRDEYSIFFKDWDVVILPDNDGPGRNHGERVRRALKGIAHGVRVLMLPGLADKGDVSDWIAAGGTREKLLALVELLPDDEEPAPDTSWFDQFLLSRSGEPLPILANALTGLRNDPTLKNRLTYNEMLCQPMLSRSPSVPIGDQEITEIHEHLQRLALRRIARDNVMWAIYSHARKSPYHPLRDHLNGIVWDGQARLDTWLAVYLGADNNIYNATVGTMFLLSMIARVFRPGCKADYMMVLEGPQGKKKSMACAILAGDDYFSDHLPEISQGKEVSQHLRGKWLIEISEMHAFNRAEATALKAFLSRTIERYRPPFHRIEVDEPRQCVFIGTSNKGQYLRDETGGRRFWPVKCGDIDIDALAEDRDQLLAEAVHRYKDGEHWWPDADFERDHIQPQQQARFEFDPWFDAIRANLIASTRLDTTVWEVAQGLGFDNRKQLGTMDMRRITACLAALGCEYKHTETGNRWIVPRDLSGSML
jgi:predicted P-loop ATPase